MSKSTDVGSQSSQLLKKGDTNMKWKANKILWCCTGTKTSMKLHNKRHRHMYTEMDTVHLNPGMKALEAATFL